MPGEDGSGNQRLELVQLDHLELVVDRPGVGRQRDELFLAALQSQPLECLLIAGEDAGGGAGLHDHVADRPPVGCGQPGDAVTEELEDQPPAAADVTPPQQLEHDVFRLHPGLQPAAQLDARDPRALEYVRLARHRHGHLGRACADRQHPERPCHGRVAVRAQQHVARPAEALEVKVVRDAVSGARVERPVTRGPTAEVGVVLGVPVVELQRVVVDVRDRRDSHAVDAESLELQAGHGAGRVLEENLVDAQLDLLVACCRRGVRR